MTTPLVAGYDATHANAGHLPAGHQAAGYTTGTPDIQWTAADWTAHPGAVRICQDFSASDITADVLDVERGAATNGIAGHWYSLAARAWRAAARPGQRRPAIYTSASNVTPLVNALIAAGVTSGPGLWVASWGTLPATAGQDVADASGPFPIIGFQYASGPFYDSDWFSRAWLAGVSRTPAPVTSPAPAWVGKALADSQALTALIKANA